MAAQRVGVCSGGSCTGSVAGFQKEVVVANTMRAHPTKDHTDPKHLFSQCRSKASTAYVATMAEFRPVITWIKRGPPGLGHMQMKKTWWHLIHVPKLHQDKRKSGDHHVPHSEARDLVGLWQ